MKVRDAIVQLQQYDPDDDIILEVMDRHEIENLGRCAFTDDGWVNFTREFSFARDGDYDDLIYWVNDQVEFGELDRDAMFVTAPERLV